MVGPWEPENRTVNRDVPVVEGFSNGQKHFGGKTCTSYGDVPVVESTGYRDSALSVQRCPAGNMDGSCHADAPCKTYWLKRSPVIDIRLHLCSGVQLVTRMVAAMQMHLQEKLDVWEALEKWS